MDPSLIEIIRNAVFVARHEGLDGEEQQAAAEACLLSMMPSLSQGTANLIVQQLYPFAAEMAFVA